MDNEIELPEDTHQYYDESPLLSFAVPVDPVPIDTNPQPNSIWETLLDAVKKVVSKDGIDPKFILEGETESDIFDGVVSQVYHDVAEFYYWYFSSPTDDDRAYNLKNQDLTVDVPTWLTDAVKPVVDENLDAMREVDEIPVGEDVAGLDDAITSSLSRYILNWQTWEYDRLKEAAIDSYFEQKSFYDDIYLDSDYGQLSNLLDDNQFDGYSDVPYLSNELGLEP